MNSYKININPKPASLKNLYVYYKTVRSQVKDSHENNVVKYIYKIRSVLFLFIRYKIVIMYKRKKVTVSIGTKLQS